jgi:hypothetical protein
MRKILTAICTIALAASGWAQLPVPLAQPPVQVPGATVGLIGNPGNGIYYYWVVARFAVGNSSPAGPFVASGAPITLSASNYFVVSWLPALGATSYDLLRTTSPALPSGACNCAVATAITATIANDQANALNTYTVDTFDPNSVTVQIENDATGPGTSALSLRQNGVSLGAVAAANIPFTFQKAITFGAGVNLSGIASGSTACLHINSLGAVSATSGDCGISGVTGFSGMTLGQPAVATAGTTGTSSPAWLFTDQLSGSTWDARLATCITDLPAAGGTCDGRGEPTSNTISLNPFASLQSGGANAGKTVHVFWPAGTITVNANVVLPSNVKNDGTGRNAGSGTTLQAGASLSGPILSWDNGNSTSVQGATFEHFSVNCNNVSTASGVQNKFGQERSWIRDYSIVKCTETTTPGAALDIETNQAQNFGPIRDGEIYTCQNASACNTSAIVPVNINLGSGNMWRGIEGLTITATNATTDPATAIQWDGGSSRGSGIHIEHYGVGIELGSQTNTNNLVLTEISGCQCTDAAQTSVIDVSASHTVSDVSILAVTRGSGYTNAVKDNQNTIVNGGSAVALTDSNVGFYGWDINNSITCLQTTQSSVDSGCFSTFANLGTPANGAKRFITNADPPASEGATCSSSGTRTGAYGIRINGVWKCF